MTLQEWLAAQPTRCPSCGYDTQHQGCACEGAARRDAALAAVIASADADVKADLEAAIRRHAAAGEVFSMNALRAEVPEATGPVVGSVFNGLAKAGVIEHVGYEPSTKANTKAHPVKTWRGAA